MTPFEEWWETTDWTGMDGPVPRQAAKEGWDAAISMVADKILVGIYFDLDREVS